MYDACRLFVYFVRRSKNVPSICLVPHCFAVMTERYTKTHGMGCARQGQSDRFQLLCFITRKQYHYDVMQAKIW